MHGLWREILLRILILGHLNDTLDITRKFVYNKTVAGHKDNKQNKNKLRGP
jgi:hypothetical protein